MPIRPHDPESPELDPATERDTALAAGSAPSAIGSTPDTGSPAPTQPSDPAEASDRATIGRFVVLERLGVGGMGVVVAAYDPTLDRKVAIKVLHGRRWRSAVTFGRSRLVAEAQAMARLSHPNVVTLHEIGFDDDGAFLVMDHVAGTTLRGWLDAAARSPREIVAMFVAAGDGLAAAHRQDIIHRDFKPDNVLVDRDGRARVTDFGIAAFVEDAAHAEPPAGTLAYMAPEQLRSAPCDGRADQFAFCVALWEALHGTPPFAGATAEDRLAAIEAGRFAEPARRPPEWLRGVLLRGLAADPSRRWPSMPALLDRLRRDPGVRRRRIALAALAGAVATAALWLAWPDRAGSERCTTAAERMAHVWDAPQQARVLAAFATTGAPFVEPAWRETSHRLDSYVASWTALANETCRATRIEHRQTDAVMDLRMGCLEERRRMLGALTEAWARNIDRLAVERAVDAAGRLAQIADCRDERALRARGAEPRDPLSRTRILAARQQLEAMQTALLTRRLDEAKRLMPIARAAAEAAGWPQLRAEEAFAEGDVMSAVSDPRVVDRYREASQLADVAHDDRLRLFALTMLASDLAERAQDGPEATRIVELAEGVLDRAGGDDLARTRLLRSRGRALYASGNYPAARAAQETMLPRMIQLLGVNSESTAAATDLAFTMSVQEDYAAAIKLYEDTLARATKVMGDEHPGIVRLLSDEATVIFDSGDVPRALEVYSRTLAGSRRVFGPESAFTALVMNNIGRAKAMTGDNLGARAMFQQALEIRLRVLGPDHPFVATTMSNLASIETLLGDYESARPRLERALAIKLKVYGPEHASVAYTLLDTAVVQAAQGDLVAAAATAQRAYEIRRKVLGAGHELTLAASGDVAHVLVLQHRCSDALPLLERALAVLTRTASGALSAPPLLIDAGTCDVEANQPARALARLATLRAISKKPVEDASSLGAASYLAARAEWQLGHRARALELAHQAVRSLGTSKGDARQLADAKAWLAGHGGRP